jgi:hypothetical protein
MATTRDFYSEIQSRSTLRTYLKIPCACTDKGT